MTTAAAPFFVDGGSLPIDAPSYVERPVDRILYERVKRGELCYLLTPRRSGKSSLLLRLRERLRNEGMKVAFVDLTMIGTNTSSDEWFYGFCRSIARELALTEAFESWWPQHLGLPATQRMVECLRYFFLGQFTEPLLILVDEIESTRKLSFGDDFLAALRACFNARAQDPKYARLNVVLAGVSTPADLIRDPGRTPFNVGSRVELTDFTMAEADGLIGGLRDRCPEPRGVLERILDWTRGHPYLTQRLCKAASAHSTGPEEIDELVETELLSEQARGKEDHFKFVRERILGGDRARAVLTLYGRVLGGPRIEADTRSPVHDALRLSDLVRVEANGTLAPRNRILATVFDQAFVHRALRWSRQTLAIAASVSITVLTAIAFVFGIQPRNYLQAIDAADKDIPNLEYRKLRGIPGWGAIANEHFARYFDRRAMTAAQNGDRDRALLYALQADSVSSKARRRAQAAALITEDLASMERTFRCGGAVRTLAFSPDGGRLITGSSDNSARLWDVRSGQPIGAPMQHQGAVLAVAFSPDGDHVLTGSADFTARLWNARTRQPIGAPMDHQGQVVAVAFSRDGKRVLTGSGNGTSRLWDAHTGQPLGAPVKYRSSVLAVAFRPDGDRVLARISPYTARLYDARTGQPIGAPMKHQSLIFTAAFSPNGNQVQTGSVDGTALVWDARTGQAIGVSMKNYNQNPLFAVASNPDSNYVLTGNADRTAQLWDPRTGLPAGSPMRHQGPVLAVAFSPDGKRILTGSDDNTARLWDARIGEHIGDPDSFSAVAFSPDGDRILTGSFEGRVQLWDAQTSQTIRALMQQKSPVLAVAFSPDGDRVLAGSGDKAAQLWDARTGHPISTPMKHQEAIFAAVFSPNGDRILTGSSDGTARQWDGHTGQPIGPLMHHQALVAAVAFSLDGNRILTGSWDNTAQQWDARTAQPIGAPMTHEDAVCAVAFSPDTNLVLTGSNDNTARLWDVRTDRPVSAPMKHQNTVSEVAFSPDGSSAWTLTRSFAYQWTLPNPGISPIGTVSLLRSPDQGPQSFRIDPTNPSRVQFFSAVRSASLVRTVDLSEPPDDFERATGTLLTSFMTKFGLLLRVDGEIFVPYSIPAGGEVANRKTRP